MACEDPEQVSAAGYGDYDDTEANWPVISGYGDLIERMAADLPVRRLTRVDRVTQEARGVRLQTADGTVTARAAIVTASTNVLLSGAIRFDAGPARELLGLIEGAPCGTYEKVAIVLRRLPDALEGRQFFVVDLGDGSAPLGVQVAASGQPLLLAHMAGSVARDLGREGAAAMVAFATGRLAAVLGPEFQKEIVRAVPTGWQQNPFVKGGYSYVKPGARERRHAMIAADTGNVAFAGEAFSRRWQATAHGAYQSGRDVAARVAGTLRRA